jgi:hypothetical protein
MATRPSWLVPRLAVDEVDHVLDMPVCGPLKYKHLRDAAANFPSTCQGVRVPIPDLESRIWNLALILCGL